MTLVHDLETYLSLAYPIHLIPSQEADGGWLAKIPALEGCLTWGETPEEALALIEDAKRAWLTFSFEAGLPIPAPPLDPSL